IWAKGFATWDAFERAEGTVATVDIDADLRHAILEARDAKTVTELAALIPEREHWRVYTRYAQEAAFLDLEADGEEQITVGGVFDREGPATFIRGTTLEALP